METVVGTASSSLTDNTNVDKSRRRSASSSGSRGSANRKGSSSSSSTCGSAAESIQAELPSVTSIRSSNRRKTMTNQCLVLSSKEVSKLSSSTVNNSSIHIHHHKDDILLNNNEQENTSSSTASSIISVCSTVSSSSETLPMAHTMILKGKNKKSSKLLNNSLEAKVAKLKQVPLAPPPPPPSPPQQLKQEVTLTEATNIEIKKKIKRQKFKNENSPQIEDSQSGSTITTTTEEDFNAQITNNSESTESANLTCEGDKISTGIDEPALNLDDNTLDGFDFANRTLKEVSTTEDQHIVDIETIQEDTTTLTITFNQMLEDNDTTTQDMDSKMDTDLALTESQTQVDSSILQEVKVKKTKRKHKSIMVRYMDQLIACSSVAKIFVYKWPQKSENPNPSDSDQDDDDDDAAEVDSYLLQEQISEYLGVKSFKRKYPDIFRRILDIKEREYLKENEIVTEIQCDLGLTALKLNDCLDIMVSEYPDKFKEFNAYLSEMKLKNMQAAAAANTKKRIDQYKARPVCENSKIEIEENSNLSAAERMKEMIRKAIKSANSYNSQLQREKKSTRSSFFDLQTMRIQKPLNKLNVTTGPKSYYPVSVLQGQFQYYYKRYTREELKFMPLNTVINNPPVPESLQYEKWKRREFKKRNNANIQSNQMNGESSEDEEMLIEEPTIPTPSQINHTKSQKITINTLYSHLNTPPAPTIQSNNTFRISASAAPTIAKLLYPQQSTITSTVNSQVICNICLNKSQNTAQIMISCSTCKNQSHPNCLELNHDLVSWSCIRQYSWECMDCKKCSHCSQSHDDDKMMFCDRCDRGFHTYCVNVSQVPEGSWLCKGCELKVNESDQDKKIDDKKIIKTFLKNNPKLEFDLKNESHVCLNNLQTVAAKSPGGVCTPLIKNRIQSRFNSHSASIDSMPGSMRVKSRGRPPGSLNKPKDPNSPKKSLNKSNKNTKRLELNLAHQLNDSQSQSSHSQSHTGNCLLRKAVSGYDDNSMDYNGSSGFNANGTSMMMDSQYDDDNSLQNSSYLNFTSNIINIPKFEFHTNNSNTATNNNNNYNYI